MAKAQLIRVVLFLKQDQQGTPENTLFFFSSVKHGNRYKISFPFHNMAWVLYESMS